MNTLQKRMKMALGFPMILALAGCEAEIPVSEPVPADAAFEEGELAIPVMGEEIDILAFGDSLFAAHNLTKPEGYPRRLEVALRSRGINAQVFDSGVSGDTTSAGLDRLEFVLNAQDEAPDLFILELGGNDLLRAIQPEETRANFEAMLTILSERDIPVLLMGMRAPTNYGPEYEAQYDALYSELAAEYDASLIPFWLEDILSLIHI